MAEFLKRLTDKTQRQVTESVTVKANAEEAEKNNRIKTKLSLHPDWKVASGNTSYALKEIMEKEVGQLPDIKEGFIGLNGIYAVNEKDHLEVGFYLRNGLSQPVRLGATKLAIVSSDNKVLAQQEFDLSKMGAIPSHTARPWELIFDKENVFVDIVKHDDWRISFMAKDSPQDEVNAALAMQQKERQLELETLKDILTKLPPVKPDQLNVTPYEVKFNSEGELEVTVVIRNGTQKVLQIENIPITVKDAQGVKVASKLFHIDEELILGKNKGCLQTFKFPPQAIAKDIDTSSFSIHFTTKKYI
ncbi:SLAP domain-containing protein [Peptococcaceae bacterium 1198_IL3148]